MQHLKTTIKSDIYNRPKKPHWKNWKIQHGGFKMATEIRKNPKKLNFFFSTSNSFKFLLDKHLKIYWRIFRRKSIRIYLEKQYGGFKMAAQIKKLW